MKQHLIDQVSQYLLIERDEVIKILDKASSTYKRYTIPKKNKSGYRVIYHPSKQTKSLQYALMETFLKKFPVHKSAAAYKGGLKSPLLKNAKAHSAYSYSIHLDFKDFFPSITSNDLIDLIRKYPEFDYFDKGDLKLIEKALFIKTHNIYQLAIGAPSSPMISNIIMYSLDDEIEKLANSISVHSSYSRYADDIVFSSNIKGSCNTFYDEIKKFLSKTKSPKIFLNENKTIFASKKGRRVVTGLIICPNKKISIGRKNKKYIKKLVNDFRFEKISEKNLKYLSGYLSYILDVEPDFYNRLALKYSAEILFKIKRTDNIKQIKS